MSVDKFIKQGKIVDGQYTVSMDLKGLFEPEDRDRFKSYLEELKDTCGGGKTDIYRLEGNKIKYRSETILPIEKGSEKRKILIVFGNPAVHSVKNGMFFFSKKENRRHSMWGKLAKAGLIKPVSSSNRDPFLARKEEAEERKRLIKSDLASEDYSLGLTTFYSFPTPVEGPFQDVQGVEKLFKPVLEKVIIPFEVDRIQNYSFSKNATLIFVQKSSHIAAESHSGSQDIAFKNYSKRDSLYWPVRGKNSAGAYLSELLENTE